MIWGVMPCIPADLTEISEQYAASVFRKEQEASSSNWAEFECFLRILLDVELT
jgi:hypothetical protein